jgi:autotransporter-associated beta strand protein
MHQDIALQNEELTMSIRTRFAAIVFLATVAILGNAETRGASLTWNVASGDWSIASNWSGTVLPTGADSALITNAGTVSVTALGETCGTLSLGSGAGTGTVQMTGTGGLSVTGNEFIGNSGNGGFKQSGGAHAVANELDLGENPGSSGSYNLSGNSGAPLLSVPTEEIGVSGNGYFTQSGGTHSVTGSLFLALNPGSSATYTLSGSGLLSANYEPVGNAGTATFTQSGGTHTVVGLDVGLQPGSIGTYNLMDGQLLPTSEAIGVVGIGNFTQSGGTHAVAIELDFGYVAGGSGSYSLSGSGLLTVPTESIGYSASGSFTQSGGTHATSNLLTVGNFPGSSGTYNLSGSGLLTATSEWVGNSGSGSFTQTGGTHTVANDLDIGYQTSGSGTYNLSGSGLLSEQFENVAILGSGSFMQTGGTHTVSNQLNLGLELGGSGTYNLSGSGLLSLSNVSIGISGSGSFTQSGGTSAISGSLIFAQNAGSFGTYNLGGGLLALSGPGLTQGAGSGAFHFSGGTIHTAANYSSAAPFVLDGNNGVFDIGGNTLTLAGGVSGSGGFTKIGAGMMVLSSLGTYSGNTTVNGGTLALLADNSSSALTAGNGATLLFSGATFHLGFDSVRATSGGNVLYQNATIVGAYLRGPGAHVALAGTSNTFNAVTTYGSTNFQQNGTATFSNFNNGGQVVNNAPLVWDGGINNAGANLIVNSTINIDDFTSAGVITINRGGAINNSLSDATFFGGSQTYVNAGGTLNTGTQNDPTIALNLQDSLLVNNGTIPGTTNVNYGATVSGTGSFGQLNVLDAGLLAIATTASPFATSLMVSSGSIAGAGQSALPATVAAATFDTPSLTDTLRLSGDLTGPGPIIKEGAGLLILGGANSYGAGTDVMAGTLEVNSPLALPGGSTLTVGANAISMFNAAIPQAVAAVPEPGTIVLLTVFLWGAAVCHLRLRCARRRVEAHET